MAAGTSLTTTREQAAGNAANGQSRTAVVSIAAAMLLVGLNLGAGILTGRLG